jgi:thioredoxin-related protein
MKQLLLIAILSTLMSLQIIGQVAPKAGNDDIEWLSWEEAISRNETEPKKIFVDVYTDWCGWCKKMDKSTFKDAQVVESLSDGFYAVKFNAEQRESIEFSGNVFKFVPGGKRGGIHELAVALLDNKMGFPSFVLLDEDMSRIMISPGFKHPADIIKELNYAREEIYKTTSWDDYNK